MKVFGRMRREPLYDTEGWTMQMHGRETAFRKIKIAKDRLLTKLRENREKHQAEFEKALVGYQRAFLVEAQALVKVVEESIAKEARVRFEGSINMTVPQDHTASYDAVIEMLEWHQADTVELSVHEFQCYVRDKWDWRSQHGQLLHAYTTTGPQGPTGHQGPAGPTGSFFGAMSRYSSPIGDNDQDEDF